MALKQGPDGVIVGVSGPASAGTAVTPSDVTAVEFRALWVGTGGNIAVIFQNSLSAVTILNDANGSLLPFMVKRVMSTNTTASNIVGLA